MSVTRQNDSLDKIMPDSASNLSKTGQVAEMFDNIAGRYDFLNHFLSLGIDRLWRKKAINEVAQSKPLTVLDVATGTGDMAIAAHRKIAGAAITGVDISKGMLAIGRKKIEAMQLGRSVLLVEGDSGKLSFPDANFDAVMCAYGVRNFEFLEQGIKEMRRVLCKGGKVVILEFSHPKKFPVAQLYRFYFRAILPAIGKAVSKNSRAYTYLPESVAAFPEGKDFCELLSRCGFRQVKAQPLTFGITSLYTGIAE